MRRGGSGAGRAAALALLAMVASGLAGAAQEEGAGLELDALVQEGELVRDELDQLAPATEALARQGAQLDAADQELHAQSERLSGDVQAYGRTMQALEKSAAEHRSGCPRESEDRALVESCNARAAEIQAGAAKLDSERPLLQQRQAELNRRIEQHNAARRDWAGRKHEHDARLALNRRDALAWLGRVQGYLGTESFRAAQAQAAKPGACPPEVARDAIANPTGSTVSRALACLQTLRR